MQFVIIAGGLGTRIRKINTQKTKSMIKINGKNFLDYQLEWIGKEKIHLCLGYGHEEILSFIESSKRIEQFTHVIENEKKGVIGALNNSLNYLENEFIVLLGDVLPKFSKKMILNDEKLYSFENSLLIDHIKNTNHQLGNIDIISKEKRVCKYKKNSDLNYFDIGIWKLNKDDLINFSKQPMDEDEFFDKLIQQNKLGFYMPSENVWEVGSLYGINELESFLQKY